MADTRELKFLSVVETESYCKAQCIARQDVPNNLADVRLVALDMGTLFSRAKYRVELTEQLKAVLKEVRVADGKFILLLMRFI
jgi:ATP-dependent Clp protease ATP-binding subunit ClpB